MKCLSPIDAWICGLKYAKDGVLSQNRVFSSSEALEYYSFMPALMEKNYSPVPCGKCAICQIRKRKDMTVRLAHERSMHKDCCFITLTYDDDHLPKTNAADWKSSESVPCLWRGDDFGYATLLPTDVQLFIKRLRRHLEYRPKKPTSQARDHVDCIRYFAVGEYGTTTHRPHYHILIFGWQPSDMVLHQLKSNHRICRSAQIEKLWTYGYSTVCDVEYGVAKYCARYVTKKFARLEKPLPDEKYICPEFTLQSVRNGGIGSSWLNCYYTNIANGFVTVRTGQDRISKCAVPKYYYDRLRKINLPYWLELRDQKIQFLQDNPPKDTNRDELKRIVKCHRLIDKVAAMRETI